MLGYFEDPQLIRRKKMLIAESEIYRETLRLELHNLSLYSRTIKTRWLAFQNATPLLAVIAPILRLIAERKKRRGGLLGTVMKGWGLYRRFGKFGPTAMAFVSNWVAKRRASGRVRTP